MANNENREYLLFIAQDTLEEIRESKKSQRDVAFNFIVISGVILGLNQVLKIRDLPQISHTVMTLIQALFGGFSIYLLIRFQGSLSKARRRISIIYDDQDFSFAFERGILKYPKKGKKRYSSFWNNFWDYTLAYILLVLVITLVIIIAQYFQ